MKILIWVHKNDVLANNISTYYFTRPLIDRHDEYLQVAIAHDEFVRLEDRLEDKNLGESWLIGQYNRNKDPKEWVTSLDQIKK
jgi:hypothetical protein